MDRDTNSENMKRFAFKTLTTFPCSIHKIFMVETFVQNLQFVKETSDFNAEHQNSMNKDKALYSLLQYIYPKCEVTEELKHNLKELMFEVEEQILHVEINPEISLIFASSFILLISICTSDPACYFYKLTRKTFERKNVDNDHIVLSSAYYLEGKINSTAENNDFNIVSNFNCNLILIHGVLNVQPEWLFNRMLIDESSTFVDNNSSLLIHLWKFVKIHASYSSCSYQGIQVLQKWIKKVCEFVKEFEKSLEQDSWIVSGKTIDTEHDSNTLKSDLSFKNCRFCTNVSTMKILCVEHGNVVKVLKANLENRIKGIVFSLILDSLKEILYLHDYFHSGHLEFSVRKFMESVLKCHHHTRGSFLFIQLTVEVLGPQRTLKDYPTITTTMGFALKTNQFATLATNIYRSVIQKITLDDWVEYFRPIHEMILQTSDVEFWSNYKNLWLPVTIYHHPKLVSLLLKVSENSTWEFESKIAILRMFRSYNDVNMFETINCNDFDILEYLTSAEEQAGDNDNEDIDFENYMPSKLFYLKCLLHGELTVRSEFFNMLCSTKKSLIPLSHFESILLKLFFSQNMNVDSQSFRQSVLKSFSNLIIRVRDCCTHEIKKYKNDFSESIVKIVLQSDMKHTIDFLKWIILHLNENLKFLGNYSRLSTTLNLYWILLETFYGNCKFSKDCGNSKYKSVGYFLNMVTRTNEDVILPSFTCRTTFNSLLFCSVNEMDDIRLSSSRILILLYQQKSLYDIGSSNCEKDGQGYEKLFCLWFDLAIKLIDSPKASDMEGGADLMNILLEIRPEKVFYVPKSLKVVQAYFKEMKEMIYAIDFL
ncbi:hypothetical protein Avbf_12141 [Armadillidium vulgare]|nr:hypothetical protein Avbf_12141 [Armadillidium vulgare]